MVSRSIVLGGLIMLCLLAVVLFVNVLFLSFSLWCGLFQCIALLLLHVLIIVVVTQDANVEATQRAENGRNYRSVLKK
jgi:ABC-type phosphate transport system permease subunit